MIFTKPLEFVSGEICDACTELITFSEALEIFGGEVRNACIGLITFSEPAEFVCGELCGVCIELLTFSEPVEFNSSGGAVVVSSLLPATTCFAPLEFDTVCTDLPEAGGGGAVELAVAGGEFGFSACFIALLK